MNCYLIQSIRSKRSSDKKVLSCICLLMVINDSQVCQKQTKTFFKIAQKGARGFDYYFCKDICGQNLTKIAQSGHTGR